MEKTRFVFRHYYNFNCLTKIECSSELLIAKYIKDQIKLYIAMSKTILIITITIICYIAFNERVWMLICGVR